VEYDVEMWIALFLCVGLTDIGYAKRERIEDRFDWDAGVG